MREMHHHGEAAAAQLQGVQLLQVTAEALTLLMAFKNPWRPSGDTASHKAAMAGQSIRQSCAELAMM